MTVEKWKSSIMGTEIDTRNSRSTKRPAATVSVSRRTALSTIAGGLSWPLLPGVAQASASRQLFLSSRGIKAGDKGGFRVSGFDNSGRVVFDIPTPGRGHVLAPHPRMPMAVLFARAPGTFARAIDFSRGKLIASFETPKDRHFMGHGAFSPDGKLLYATENDFANKHGVIGVYDVDKDFQRRGEFPSGGIGPHELRLAGDGNTLVICNGGILTHPSLPRVKLNRDTMEPSLVYLDRRDGRQIDKLGLPKALHQLSIRHMAISQNGVVAFGMQYAGPKSDHVPLVGVHEPGGSLKVFSGPDRIFRAMKNYCGSVEFDSTGSVIATSSPYGGIVAFWEAESGKFLSSVDIPAVCGVAPTPGPGKFVATSIHGGAVSIDAATGSSSKITGSSINAPGWDNHLVAATT